jgi:nucleoside-diphosphate-sugar epimerase
MSLQQSNRLLKAGKKGSRGPGAFLYCEDHLSRRSGMMNEVSSNIAAYFRGKTILVTGAAGFVGSHLVRHLHALGAQVVAIDRIPGESLVGVRWVIADLMELTPKHLEGIALEIAFHLASIVGVSYTGQNPVQTLAVNAIGTSRVLKLARTLGAKIICLTSSSEVYGEPDSIPITEDSTLHPLSIYGWSKVCAEQLLEAYVQSGDLCGVVIRPFNVYGPGQRSDFVVSHFLQLIRQRLPPMVVGNGMQRRIFTYVDDLIYGILLAIVKSKPGFQIYNLAGEEDISIAELADLIVSIVGSDARPIYVQLSDLERDSATEVHVRIASTEKARRELGYRPQISLEQGLKETYAQMLLESSKVEVMSG